MATITGDDRANTLTGTAGADTIRARGGDDRLVGLGGADKLYGELGNDVLDGGTGDDLLDGGPGRDIATYASLGSRIDVYIDDPALFSVASAADGRDTAISVEGLVGTAYGDSITGSIGLIRGGGGDDSLSGGLTPRGVVEIYGGPGNDNLRSSDEGGTGYVGPGDLLRGGGGNDRIFGVDGDDRLHGDAGADELAGGPGRDLLYGGAGRDTFVYFNVDVDAQDEVRGDFGPDLVADFRRGEDEIRLTAGDAFAPPSEQLQGFADLDSNRNRVLDDGDRYVEVERVAFGGTTKLSTVIDVSAYPGGAQG
jgi:Ca2+-binding RTX toxin-like protein